jgi:hypothetical protein
MNAAVTALALMLPASDDLPPLAPAAGQDNRLTALERRVAELCERLDRPAPLLDKHPLSSNGLEVQSAPPAAYTAVCGLGTCSAMTPAFGPIAYPGAVWGPAMTVGNGGCSGGNCGAPAAGMRGSFFGRFRR